MGCRFGRLRKRSAAKSKSTYRCIRERQISRGWQRKARHFSHRSGAERLVVMAGHSRIVILDFGSQYTQVIARRVRECQVYSQIVPFDTPAKEIAKLHPKGIILSGGPSSVYGKGAPHPDKAIFELGIPILGICYGVQLMAHFNDGKVE